VDSAGSSWGAATADGRPPRELAPAASLIAAASRPIARRGPRALAAPANERRDEVISPQEAIERTIHTIVLFVVEEDYASCNIVQRIAKFVEDGLASNVYIKSCVTRSLLRDRGKMQ
jgi:hypothetical protein